MKNEKQIILEAILLDRKNGVKLYPKEYLSAISPYGDRLKALNRIQRVFSDNKDKISLADSECIYAITDDTGASDKPITIEDYFEYATEGQRINKALSDYNYNVSFSFDEPTVVVVSSDEHIGSTGCDYDETMSNAKFIVDNNVKLIQNGDMTEQKRDFPKNLFSVLSQVLSPVQQEDFATKLLVKLKPNILCSVEGNHGSNARNGNDHSMRKCCKAAGIQYHEGAALLEIDICGAKYRIYCRHKPLSMSKLSPLIGVRKMADMERADIYVGSHLHRPTYGVDWPMGEMRVCILTGTMNTDATYSKVGYGEYSARAEFPALLLFPRTKKIMVFTSMRDAVLYRDFLKGKLQLCR